MLHIDIQGLEEGNHEIVLEPTPEEIDLEATEFSGITVSARIDFNPRRVLVRLKASALASLVCDRTLVSYSQPVENDCVILFAADPSLTGEGTDYDDVRPLQGGVTRLDVSAAVRDTLLLALPLRRVAPEAEGIDLPSRFGGGEDDIDPRWEALRPLSDP